MRNPVLIGERVYLRPLEVADGETLARYETEETDTFMYRGRQPLSPLAFEGCSRTPTRRTRRGTSSSPSACARTTC